MIVIANVLRKVLRLIHCLQKERGSSCAYTVALNNTISSITVQEEGVGTGLTNTDTVTDTTTTTIITAPPDNVTSTTVLVLGQVEAEEIKNTKLRRQQLQQKRHCKKALAYALSVLIPSRKETDICFTILLTLIGNTNTTATTNNNTAGITASLHSLYASLKKIRQLIPVDNTIHNHSSTTIVVSFHRILVCYNALIQSIIHDHVIRYTRIDNTNSNSTANVNVNVNSNVTLKDTNNDKDDDNSNKDSELYKTLRFHTQKKRHNKNSTPISSSRHSLLFRTSQSHQALSTLSELQLSSASSNLGKLVSKQSQQRQQLQKNGSSVLLNNQHSEHNDDSDNKEEHQLLRHYNSNSTIASSAPTMMNTVRSTEMIMMRHAMTSRQSSNNNSRMSLSEPPEMLPSPSRTKIDSGIQSPKHNTFMKNNKNDTNKDEDEWFYLDVDSEQQQQQQQHQHQQQPPSLVQLVETTLMDPVLTSQYEAYDNNIVDLDDYIQDDDIEPSIKKNNNAIVYSTCSSVGNSDTDDNDDDNDSNCLMVEASSSDKETANLTRLLRLLESFVRLKESTGVERATLCSILAAGKIESHLLINDLVMEAENHRQQLDSILQYHHQQQHSNENIPRFKKTATVSIVDNGNIIRLQDLINEMVAMPPAMEKLQNTILHGFDLFELQKNEYQYKSSNNRQKNNTNTKSSTGPQPSSSTSSLQSSSSTTTSSASSTTELVQRNDVTSDITVGNENLWNLLTLYIDKLHSLELLLVEEIECSLLAKNNNKDDDCTSTVGTSTINANVMLNSTTTGSDQEAYTIQNKNVNKSELSIVIEESMHGNAYDHTNEKLNIVTTTSHTNDRIQHDTQYAVEGKKSFDQPNSNMDEISMFFQQTFGIGTSTNNSSSTDLIDPKSIINILRNTSPEDIQQKLIQAVQQNQQHHQEQQANKAMVPAEDKGIIVPIEVCKTKESEVAQKEDNEAGAAILPTSKIVEDFLQQMALSSPVFAMKEWEIDLYEIKFRKRIGQGAAGTTYLADWSGLPVAVKVASINEMGLEGWRTEVHALQKLHHPNIIRLLGSVCHANPLTFCLVLEYCDAGDLSKALASTNTPKNFFFNVASCTAKGVSYLHSRGVIHRDIKPSNILLHGDIASGNFQVKVTDFGVATDFSKKNCTSSLNDSSTKNNSTSHNNNRTAETGTYRWMAPEVIRHEKYSQTADVYSYGIVLWQLLTREEPFHDRGQIEAAAAVAIEQCRPPIPDGIPNSIKDCIETCWNEIPANRLSFDEIIVLLNTIEKSILPNDLQWIQSPIGHWVYRTMPDIIVQDDNNTPTIAAMNNDGVRNMKSHNTVLKVPIHAKQQQQQQHQLQYPENVHHKKKHGGGGGIRTFFTKKNSSQQL